MIARLTEWFRPDVKPTIPGLYDCKSIYGTFNGSRWWWDGEVWLYAEKEVPLFHQDREWRGLAEKPE
jgi:hypothetical protein